MFILFNFQNSIDISVKTTKFIIITLLHKTMCCDIVSYKFQIMSFKLL